MGPDVRGPAEAAEGGVRGRERYDPMPPGGLCEWLYPRLRVLDGVWHPGFLEQVKRFYNGKIPERFQRVAREYAAARARAAEADRVDGAG